MSISISVAYVAEIERLRATIERLREYAGHRPLCRKGHWSFAKAALLPCDCGYDELMAEMEETK